MSKQKYRMLFSSKRRRKPGPKGPSAELVHAAVEMKQRNPNWGSPRIAQQIAVVFHIPIDKDVVRRILAHHYPPGLDSVGPSWLPRQLIGLTQMQQNLSISRIVNCAAIPLRKQSVSN
jgi:hypothetical protein